MLRSLEEGPASRVCVRTSLIHEYLLTSAAWEHDWTFHLMENTEMARKHVLCMTIMPQEAQQPRSLYTELAVRDIPQPGKSRLNLSDSIGAPTEDYRRPTVYHIPHVRV